MKIGKSTIILGFGKGDRLTHSIQKSKTTSAQSPSRLPSIVSYKDYRIYIREACEYLRKTSRGMSLRRISKLIGSTSSVYMSSVISGNRSFQVRFVEPFSQLLGLTIEEQSYFTKLVIDQNIKNQNVGQKPSPLCRAIFQVKQLDLKQNLSEAELTGVLLRNWYLIPILELVELEGFQARKSWIKNHIQLPLSPDLVIEAIEFLIRHQFIEKRDGRLQKTNKRIFGGDKLDPKLVTKYHCDQARLAAVMIGQTEIKKREANATTLCLDAERFRQLKSRLQEFQREIMKEFGGDAGRSEVVQVNIQMFPLNRQSDEGVHE